jgi:hypothetical protein
MPDPGPMIDHIRTGLEASRRAYRRAPARRNMKVAGQAREGRGNHQIEWPNGQWAGLSAGQAQ